MVQSPNPKLVFNSCYPYWVPEPNISDLPYSVSTLSEWPFDYSISATLYVDGDPSNPVRRFLSTTLIGLDWDSDIAIFDISYDPSIQGIPGTINGLPVVLFPPSITIPEIYTAQQGTKVEAFSDAYGIDSDIYVSGNVRSANSQLDPLRSPVVNTDMSFSASSSGCALVYVGTNNLLGIHRASIKSNGTEPAFLFTMDTPGYIVKTVLTKILNAVFDADNQSDLVPANIFMVIVATQSLSMGLVGKLLRLNDLTRDIKIDQAEGYLYERSLPYYTLEGLVNKSDIVYKIRQSGDATPWSEIKPLGSFPGQINLYNAIEGLTGPNVDVLTREYAAGGWYVEPTEYLNLELKNYVGDFWTWWFIWLLAPSAPELEDINSVYMDSVIKSLFSKNNPSPKEGYFVPLNTYSLRVPTGGKPSQEQLTIDAIVKQSVLYNSAFIADLGGSRKKYAQYVERVYQNQAEQYEENAFGEEKLMGRVYRNQSEQYGEDAFNRTLGGGGMAEQGSVRRGGNG